MLRKLFILSISISSFLFTNAQTASVPAPGSDSVETSNADTNKKPFFAITGSADVYYRYDFTKTKANNLTSFTNSHNSFALGMASLKAEHKSDKVGAVIDLGFGQRATEFSYNENGILAAIKQLYVSYSPTEWLKLTAGTWATHVGYELLDPQLNRNYSMSYMFTNGPFSHTGLKAEVTEGKSGFMLGISNATDFRTPPDEQINKKFLIGQYSLAVNDNVKLYLNYVGGKSPDTSKVNQFDFVATAKVNDKFNVGFNATVNNTKSWNGIKNLDGKSWWGSALYLNVDPQSWFGFTLRTEYFNDKNNLKIPHTQDGCNIFATTFSANFKANGFILIPEFRIDNSSTEIFVDKTGAPKKSFGSFLLAAVYSF